MPTANIEREHGNNHTTYYYVQVAAYARFAGRDAFARAVLDTMPKRLIVQQIEPDGSQPRELARTMSMTYSLMNLWGLCMLARMGEGQGVDLWHYESQDGRSIRRALAFLEPYTARRADWRWPQITEPKWPSAAFLLRLAAPPYHDPAHGELARQVPLDAEAAVMCKLISPLEDDRADAARA